MSSYAMYERYYAGEQPRIRRGGDSSFFAGSSAGKRRDGVNLNRLFTGLILFLLLVIFGELLFHLVLTPRLVIRRVTVSVDGISPLSDEQILKIAGLDGVVSYIGLSEADVAARLSAHPMIRTATVTKQFPDRLAVQIEPRRALASVLAVGDGKTVPLYVDSEGVILAADAAPAEISMPVISGVRLVDVRPGMRFPDQLVGYLEQLAVVQAEAPELYNLISEIKFVKKSTASYEIVLFPGHARLRVRTGPELNVEMLRSILLVIDVVKQQGLLNGGAELDFRTGDVVYRSGRG